MLFLRTLGFWLLALHVLIVPQGLSLSFCTAGLHGWWSDAGVESDVSYGCSAPGWCSARCVHDHEDAGHEDAGHEDAALDHTGSGHDCDRGEHDTHQDDRSRDVPEGPTVDLPSCPGCQSVVFDDGLAESAGVRVPQVDAPAVDPFVLLEPVLPDGPRVHALAAPPGAVRSTGRLPGALPLRV